MTLHIILKIECSQYRIEEEEGLITSGRIWKNMNWQLTWLKTYITGKWWWILTHNYGTNMWIWSLSRLQRGDMWANIVSVISWLVCDYECTAKLDWIGPRPFPSPQQTFHKWATQLAHLWQLIWYRNANGNQEAHTWQWTGTEVAYMWQLFNKKEQKLVVNRHF